MKPKPLRPVSELLAEWRAANPPGSALLDHIIRMLHARDVEPAPPPKRPARARKARRHEA